MVARKKHTILSVPLHIEVRKGAFVNPHPAGSNPSALELDAERIVSVKFQIIKLEIRADTAQRGAGQSVAQDDFRFGRKKLYADLSMFRGRSLGLKTAVNDCFIL